jgi:ribonucleotide monophosphatase NagD (HAD superfamily)
MSSSAYISDELMFSSIKEMLNSIATPKLKPKNLVFSMQATIKYASRPKNGIDVWVLNSIQVKRDKHE